MNAKPGLPANTALPTLAETADAAAATLSPAFSRALGAKPSSQHPGVTPDSRAKRAALKEKTAGPGGFARPVTVKPIAPRSGHR